MIIYRGMKTLLLLLACALAAAAADAGGVKFVSVTLVPQNQPNGKNALLKFHFSAPPGRELPRQLTIGINGKATDAEIDGEGAYLVTGRVSPKRLPKSAVTLAPGVATPNFPTPVPIPTRCPPGCKSILFGSDCVICFRIIWLDL